VDAGASWICLHPRTADQVRRGSADWSQIQFLKEKHQVSIIGNGDIQTADDVLEMLSQTKTDLVMSGRALAARPWMVWQLGEKLGFENPLGRSEGERPPLTPEEEAQEYGRVLLDLSEKNGHYFGESLALRKIRFHIRMTSMWLDFGHGLTGLAARAESIADFQTRVREFFSSFVQMNARTELRM
jgi:tRNA-dihydrouridine synthase